MLFLLTCGITRGLCDTLSGPHKSTIQKCSWGTFYYEPTAQSPCKLETTSSGFRYTSGQGVVTLEGTEVMGYRLVFAKEFMTIKQVNGKLTISRQDGATWTLRSENEKVILTSPMPKDTLVFARNSNVFTITGSKGTVTVATNYNDLSIKSPLGITKHSFEIDVHSFSGPAMDQIPYLGRGIYIPFHGVGIFVNIDWHFPMPEVMGWLEWKPVLEP